MEANARRIGIRVTSGAGRVESGRTRVKGVPKSRERECARGSTLFHGFRTRRSFEIGIVGLPVN